MTELVGDVAALSLQPKQFLGIPIAVIGAMFLSIGAQLQHHGVAKVEAARGEGATKGLGVQQLLLLIRRPSWVIGSLMLALAILFQLTSLYLSPLIVVQPLGAVALVATSLLNARVSKTPLNRQSITAICLCVGGIAAFVFLAAFYAREVPVSDVSLIIILLLLAAVLVAFLLTFFFLRHRFVAIMYIVGAGVCYAFVVTLAKVMIARVSQGTVDPLLILCFLGICCAGLLGGYFIQNAYSSGPPDLVIAGLTVIDPVVAVSIAIIILQEATDAPLWVMIGFVLTGAVAVFGVFMLARYHPQSLEAGAAAGEAVLADKVNELVDATDGAHPTDDAHPSESRQRDESPVVGGPAQPKDAGGLH